MMMKKKIFFGMGKQYQTRVLGVIKTFWMVLIVCEFCSSIADIDLFNDQLVLRLITIRQIS